ncbi:hypothetical protein RV03_GL000294 [Enterococcus gallinarum]|nr:hypothetical protein RV03_GL000294 [Enterococcus gallinarum]
MFHPPFFLSLTEFQQERKGKQPNEICEKNLDSIETVSFALSLNRCYFDLQYLFM